VPQPFRDFWAISYRNHANRDHPGREGSSFQVCSRFFLARWRIPPVVLVSFCGLQVPLQCKGEWIGIIFPHPNCCDVTLPQIPPHFFGSPPEFFSRSREPLDQQPPSRENSTPSPAKLAPLFTVTRPNHAILAPMKLAAGLKMPS